MRRRKASTGKGSSAAATAAATTPNTTSAAHTRPLKSSSNASTPSKEDLLRKFTDSEIKLLKQELATSEKRFRKRAAFVLGAILGILIAAMVYRHNEFNFDKFVEQVDVDKFIDDIRLTLPKGIFPSGVSEDGLLLRNKTAIEYGAFSVGQELRSKGVSANLPVIMIPGVISTGLESWSVAKCSLPYFRKRLWGSWTMLRAMLLDKQCWKEQLMLDLETGLDPEGVKLRAAQGFDAADFFVTGYWIWNKIIENLAAIGYDPNNMFSAAYDWRLSFINLEERDKYFTKLKSFIELSVAITGKKSVIVAHSMGAQVVLWFFKWVEAEGYGNGGSSWCEKHIASFINISGSLLGTPKAVTALLSGEMRDTAQLNAFSVYGLERFYSKKERADILRSLPGISSMLPKGGDAIWGGLNFAPDDGHGGDGSGGVGSPPSFGSFLNFQDRERSTPVANMTMSESLEFLMERTPHTFHRMVSRNYSHGVATSRQQVEENNLRPEKWINPLEVSLPFAPSMKIFCLYGVGKPTERSYVYEQGLETESEEQCTTSDCSSITENAIREALPLWIDSSASLRPNLEKGVFMGEGDGTVSLLSSAFMCVKGWKEYPRYNPANISVYAYEMNHEPADFDIRGGPKTADHVDILGRTELNELILRIAAGQDSIEERFFSRVREYAARIDLGNPDD